LTNLLQRPNGRMEACDEVSLEDIGDGFDMCSPLASWGAETIVIPYLLRGSATHDDKFEAGKPQWEHSVTPVREG